MNEIITSPCISICKSDPLTGFCYGCGRTNEDKINWKNPNTLNSWKEKNLSTIRDRLSGWQKNAFEESYLSKQKTGMSLLKRKIIEDKIK